MLERQLQILSENLLGGGNTVGRGGHGQEFLLQIFHLSSWHSSVTVSQSHHSRQQGAAGLSESGPEPRTPTLRYRLTSPGAATSGSATPRLLRASQVGVPPYY